jgi:cyclic-di-AMP phosphodiesterase PgpH
VKTVPGRRPGRAGNPHTYLLRAARIALGAFVVAAGTLAFPHGPAVVSPLARVALLVLFAAAFALYLRYEHRSLYENTKFLGLCAVLASLTFALSAVATRVVGLNEFVSPVVLGALILSALFDKRVALHFSLLLVVALAAVAGFRATFVPVAAVSSVVAVYSVIGLRHRWQLYRALVYIVLSQSAAILAVDLGQFVSMAVLGRDLVAGAVGSFASCLLGMGILPFVERVYEVPSDMTLLELSDLNRPLLRRLMLEAPGTYHHSLVVGGLAEMAAESVGASALLARVGAYYHDIGKIAKPEYFTENEGGVKSRHATLAPSMSALVIKSHVAEGLEIARREKLPRRVREVIGQHHGTTMVAFFYAKALDLDPTTRDTAYRYSGPRPQSQEAAIVMLADAVEGASRSLTDPTPARLRGLVNKIVNLRLGEGELDESGLNLSDVARIREAFITVLTARFHTRVAYPDLPAPRLGKVLPRVRSSLFRR